MFCTRLQTCRDKYWPNMWCRFMWMHTHTHTHRLCLHVTSVGRVSGPLLRNRWNFSYSTYVFDIFAYVGVRMCRSSWAGKWKLSRRLHPKYRHKTNHTQGSSSTFFFSSRIWQLRVSAHSSPHSCNTMDAAWMSPKGNFFFFFSNKQLTFQE